MNIPIKPNITLRASTWMRRALTLLLVFMAVAGARAASTTVVISQIYGGGGNSGATLKNDFIELHNISTSAVNVTGWTVQYASATGSSWATTALSGTIPPGGYYLVGEVAGAGGTANLPTPDASGSLNLSGTAGKVALVNNSTALTGTAFTGANIVDFVGFGTTATTNEGSGPAPAPSNTTADLRNNNGTTDTDNNASDFITGTPAPRNSATTPFLPVGPATTINVETKADGSGTVVPAQNAGIGNSLTVYAISRDANNSFVGNASATWSLTSVTGGVQSTDLAPATDGKSAVFTGNLAGTAQIQAATGTLTSVNSGTLTVVATPTNPVGQGTTDQASVAAGQSVQLTVTVTPGANPTSTGFAVSGDLTAIGGASNQVFNAGANSIFTYQATIPATQQGGTITIPVTIQDGQGRSSTTSISFKVLGQFTILHMNDQHARITPHYWVIPSHSATVPAKFELVGGAPCFATEMLQLKTQYPDSLVIDAGDISEGNPLGDMGGNESMVQFYQLLDTKLKAQGGRGIDAMVVGNHDVRFKSYIDNLKHQSNFPVISINICSKGTQTPYFQPYVIVTVNGTKIGILGYTTGSTQIGTDLASTLDLVACDWNGTDPATIHVANYVNELRNVQHCDLVILATHAGHTELCAATPSVIADTADAKVPEIAITGHWHTWCESVWQPSILNYKTTFMESGSYIHYLGEMHVSGGGKYLGSIQHVIRDADLTPDPDVSTLIDNLKTQYAAGSPQYGLDQVIGYSADDLLLDKEMKWWSGDEYPWDGDNTAGQWICDGMLWKATQLFGPCDMCIESGGGVRSDIPKGPVTYTQIYETYPWNDDTIYVVKMTGQEIFNYIAGHGCDVGFSKGWFVTASNGVPVSLTYNGQPVNMAQVFRVAISNYMYANDTVPFSDPSPQTSTYLARQALIEYTSQFTQANPLHMGGSRYSFDTEFSGGYRAVVTMMNDADTQTSFDDGFIRLLSATPETLARLGSRQVPTSLVNPDGSVNQANRLASQEWYRSLLGFKTGAVKAGDIVEIYGKGSFYGGNPEFVDQEGIQSDGVEFKIVGHDDSLAQPVFMASIQSFWDMMHTNQYVKFFAKKTGASTVTDQNGTTITIQDVTAYSAKTLPGNVGDLLQLTGVPTSETNALRFRCNSSVVASTSGVAGYPPDSHVDPIVPNAQSASTLSLSATAVASNGSGVTTVLLAPVADAQVVEASASTNYATNTRLSVESAATGSFLDERSWLKFDLSTLPTGSTISGARLKMYCWSAAGAALPAALCPGTSDSWTESGITWSNQPGFGNAIDTQTLAAGVKNVWYTWDATSYVQAKYSGDKLVSLVVKAVTEGSTDATAPSYAFDSREYTTNTSDRPYLEVDTPNTGPVLTITQVQFFYRYSADHQNWSAWTPYQTVTTAPWTVNFNYPSGYGYYEFYSIATDSAGTVEPAPINADASVYYSATAVATVSITATADSASEQGPAAGAFAISRTGDTSAPLKAYYSIGGTAANGIDYATLPSSVTIPAGSNSANFAIAPIPDSINEGDRVVTLTLASNPVYVLGTAVSASVTIRELSAEGWRKVHFTQSELNNPAIGGLTGDASGDGVANLIKYALDLDPKANASGSLPVPSMEDGPLTLTYTQLKYATDVVYIPEVTSDFSSWSSESGSVSVEVVTDNGLTYTVKATSLLPLIVPQFMRLRIEALP